MICGVCNRQIKEVAKITHEGRCSKCKERLSVEKKR